MTLLHNDYESVLRSIDDAGICRLTLNRPEKLNALSEQALDVFLGHIHSIKDDSKVRVVVIEANGKAFSAGHDLAELHEKADEKYYRHFFKKSSTLMLSLLRLPQPVIACVQGMATAAGCQLVANCDLAIASTSARFAVSGINLGLFCYTPGVAISRNISRKHSLEMLMTGDFIDANTAVEYGLVNRAVPADILALEVTTLAQKLCGKPRQALAAGKENFYQHIHQPYDTALESAGEAMARNLMFPETRKRIEEFLGY